jgi:dTDP-4-dehydrorhamnose 3,5-epimerase
LQENFKNQALKLRIMAEISGVEIKKLQPHADERGIVIELLRSDDRMFEKFGQAYMSTCKPGIAKAWHYHVKQTEYFACVKGIMKLVLFDDRWNSLTKGVVQEIFLSPEKPLLVKVPAYVYHGFECSSDEEIIAINFKTEPFNPKAPDKIRIPFNDPKIPYKWNSKKGG